MASRAPSYCSSCGAAWPCAAHFASAVNTSSSNNAPNNNTNNSNPSNLGSGSAVLAAMPQQTPAHDNPRGRGGSPRGRGGTPRGRGGIPQTFPPRQESSSNSNSSSQSGPFTPGSGALGTSLQKDQRSSSAIFRNWKESGVLGTTPYLAAHNTSPDNSSNVSNTLSNSGSLGGSAKTPIQATVPSGSLLFSNANSISPFAAAPPPSPQTTQPGTVKRKRSDDTDLVYRPTLRYDNLEPVTVVVGSEKKPFLVWKSFLCAVSPYFEGVFNGGTRESTENTVELDTDPETFAYFLEWLHSRCLVDDKGHKKASQWPYDLLFNLYVFSDTFNVLQLKRDVLQVLWTHVRLGQGDGQALSLKSVTKAYSSLPEKDPLLEILAEKFAVDFDMSQLKQSDGEQYPNDFLFRVLSKVKGKGAGSGESILKKHWCPFQLSEEVSRKTK
ncbi:hypothetical protein NA57DRAFT_54579 [Rhizodiscina lignyota]|uniref:BTB domain-containing protein n=1 Tax=Rhizodiscina lignyota TaxID=1504668 RepID=A0A9P4M7Y5_9PEZI|nr:hypothetical protein NA57DRAFT_54579 [Rhizodiscina lignyota]